jgi:hypothetical protein
MAAKTDEEVVALYEARRTDPSQLWRNEALKIRALMNGDIFAPVTEKFGENEAVVVANQAQLNLDQMAKRTVSTQPNIRYTALRQGSQASEAKARKRQLANLGWWDKNNMKLLDRKRVRWLLGFGSGPVQISAHDKLPVPKWTLRDPLTTFPAPSDYQDSFTPEDCVYAYQRNYAWVRAMYPDAAFKTALQAEKFKKKLSPDTQFEIVEYIDAEERILILVGRDIKPSTPQYAQPPAPTGLVVRLDRIENRLGICPVVTPHLINIDRLKSPYIGNYGMYQMRNKLAALEYLYAEKTVFPERYFEEPPNSPNGEIVVQADGEEGILGHVRGGQLRDMALGPNFTGTQMIDRLEREERLVNSTPAEMGGESASNVRTAKRGNDIMAAAIDFTIQETQEILELAKEQENRLAVKVFKTYINKPTSFYVGWGKEKSTKVDFGPNDFETDENHVIYASSGADINQLVISGGQRIAQQTMSRSTFMGLDPMVEDQEREEDQIVAEQLRQSILTEMLQPGSLDVVAKARVAELVSSNAMSLPEAIAKVQRERQEAQASDGEHGEPNGPVAPGSPEAQPGIAGPGAAQPASIAPTPDQMGLSQALSALRRPQMTGATGA